MSVDPKEAARLYLFRKEALDKIESREPTPGKDPEIMTYDEAARWLAWHEEWKSVFRILMESADNLALAISEESRHPMKLVPHAERLLKK